MRGLLKLLKIFPFFLDGKKKQKYKGVDYKNEGGINPKCLNIKLNLRLNL